MVNSFTQSLRIIYEMTEYNYGEVKSNFEEFSKGLNAFNEKFKPYRSFIVVSAAMNPEEFFSIDQIMLFD